MASTISLHEEDEEEEGCPPPTSRRRQRSYKQASAHRRYRQHSYNYKDEPMDRARHVRELHRRADFVGLGLAAVFPAASFLVVGVVGDAAAGTAFGSEWQAILAFGLMSAGLLCIMHGIRARDARPPPGFVLRVADAAGAVLWHAGGPERLLLLVVLLMCPFLEAWFDFF